MASGEFNHIAEAMKAIEDGIKKAIRDAATEGVKLAQDNAAVDTGYMRDHVYEVTSAGSTYQEGPLCLPEVEKPEKDTEALIASGASYSVYVEYGTHKMGSQPFMTPMSEALRARLPDLLAHSINDAIKRVAK